MMRILATLAAFALLGSIAAPTVAASGVPEPYICGALCVILLNIVVPCALAEAQQDVFDSGAGCYIVNAQQRIADCLVREVELVLGVGSACPP